jgi:hypothetical protein
MLPTIFSRPFILPQERFTGPRSRHPNITIMSKSTKSGKHLFAFKGSSRPCTFSEDCKSGFEAYVPSSFSSKIIKMIEVSPPQGFG